MADNKNQHYVPQFYLKGFSSDGRTIGTYALSSAKYIEKATIKNQCSEDYFYPGQQYEEALSKLEQETAPVFNKVTNKEKLSDSDILTLRLFVVLQNTRTKKAANQMKKGAEIITQYLKGLGMTNELDEAFSDSPKTQKEFVELMASLFKDTFSSTIDLSLKVICNTSNSAFITSDSPVITSNKFLERLHHLNYGLTSKGIILLLPISPTFALVLYDARTYKIGDRKAQYVSVGDATTIRDMNVLSVLHADSTLHFNSSITKPTDILTLISLADKFHQTNEMIVESYQEDNGNGELLHSYNENYCINAHFGFIKELDVAKAVHSLNRKSFNIQEITRAPFLNLEITDGRKPPKTSGMFSKKVFSSKRII